MAIMKAEYHRIEWACERAVQEGRHGVKVVRCCGRLISAEPSAEVPYGMIHEHLLHDGTCWEHELKQRMRPWTVQAD